MSSAQVLSTGTKICDITDHVAVVLGQLVVHMLRGVCQKVAVLMNRAALDRQILAPQPHERSFQPRGTINDHGFGPFQPARIKIIEELSSCSGALAAHFFDGKQHLR